MSPLLQILAIYIATSLAAGLTLGVALGTMIRRAERRHRQHVAQLMRSRTCKPWLISRAHTSAAAPRTLRSDDAVQLANTCRLSRRATESNKA
jgi:hypothetical protein